MEFQKGKGYARILVDDVLRPPTIATPKKGEVIWDGLICQQEFDNWKSYLLLPESYAIIGAFFDVSFYRWILIVQSDELPTVPQTELLPIMKPIYQVDSGKVSILRLETYP